METFFVYADGGAVGNPGPAGIGVVIKNKDKKTLKSLNRYIGQATNNQAEYQALIAALKMVRSLVSKASKIKVFLDSELIVSQLNLEYKVKNSELQPLFLKAHNLAISLGKVSFHYIPREQNKEADKLVKVATKEYLSKMRK